MWALAIWDKEEEQLFLSRDRFGVKPLFYARKAHLAETTVAKSSFVFASEMKAITPFLKSITPNTKLVLDLDNIFYYESTKECLIKEIERFPAGYYAWVRNGEITLHRFWNTLDHIKKVTTTYDEQVKEFNKLFLQSCAMRMRADVTMGTALSGGLDSSAVFSTVAHLAKENLTERAGNDWQHAFCASFPGSPVDEERYARKVTDHLGVTLETVVIDPLKNIHKLYDYLYMFEDMYITSPIPFVELYGAMSSNGVKVTLDGHGADEFFGGYNFDFLHILKDEFFNPRSVYEVFKVYFNTQTDNADFKKTSKVLFVIKTLAKALIKKIINHKNISRESKHPIWGKLDYFTQKLYISSHETVLPTLLRNYDRYSMIHGVEIRMPFMDYKLVTYALSLPWQSKLRNGYSKAIIRDGTKDYMPHSVAFRKSKIGWNSTTTDWIHGPLKKFFMDTVTSEDFISCKLINAKELKVTLESIINNPQSSYMSGESLWRAMSPYFWERGFLKRIIQEAQDINPK
jgi:asparagine synthase (glutamine-hydrolysing)